MAKKKFSTRKKITIRTIDDYGRKLSHPNKISLKLSAEAARMKVLCDNLMSQAGQKVDVDDMLAIFQPISKKLTQLAYNLDDILEWED